MNKFFDDDETEFERARKTLGEIVKYVDKDCPQCGRHRVELFECGKEICEKCHWCITDNEYSTDHIVGY